MTEGQSSVPATKIRKRNYRYLVGMAVGFLVFPTIAFTAARRMWSWPYIVFGAVSVGIPFLLIGVRAWKRWFHPDRVPVRWPNGYKLMARLQTLNSALSWIWVIGLVMTWVFDRSTHHRAYVALGFLACGAAAWDNILTLYIADRKYITPPNSLYDPPKDTKRKPLQSDHWGSHNFADSDPNAVPSSEQMLRRLQEP
jgi:hypothetical protein